MAARQPLLRPINGHGPGSAAVSTAMDVLKPGAQTPCIDCGDAQCCCIPIPCVVL
ncbi:hypothetical protein E4U55_008134 [Claviceps digitariae]|nr:hypothetical protein E4U55_008134 [Claviceps digitariae]